MRSRAREYIRRHGWIVATFFVLSGGTAWAAHPGGGNTISSRDIIDAEVKAHDLAPDSVRQLQLRNGAVGRPELHAGAVVRRKINNGAVDEAKLADLAVTLPKLADGAVDSAKVVDDSLSGDDIQEPTLQGLWRLGGNSGTTGSDFLGTTDNQPLNLRVNGSRALRLEPADFGGTPAPNLIGGSPDNAVTSGALSATISGGGLGGSPNRVTDDFGTVGGGEGNQAGDGAGSTGDSPFATVGGGRFNTASGFGATVGGGAGNDASGLFATVGGGNANTAASGFSATVGGGNDNTASGFSATVGGGNINTASGIVATVGGGNSNTAAGDASFVAGNRAKNTNADHDGVFLFADRTDADFNSVAANEFAVRAAGGFRFRTSADLSTGCNLPAGSGTFVCTSDRAAKRGFRRVHARSVLSRLSRLPIASWSYESDPTGARHIGPTAQAFRRAFGLGSDRRSIATVDADGVALAAIKALERRVDRLRDRVRELER